MGENRDSLKRNRKKNAGGLMKTKPQEIEKGKGNKKSSLLSERRNFIRPGRFLKKDGRVRTRGVGKKRTFQRCA